MVRGFWCFISVLMAVLAPMSAYADDFSYDDRYMVVVDPAPGREVVGELDMSFCEGLEKWDDEKHRVASATRTNIEVAQRRSWEDEATPLIKGLCTYPDDPGFRQQTRHVVQLVVNQSGRSTEGAIESLVARSDSKRWKAEKERGCDAIKEPEEASERDMAFYRAHRVAVGCSNKRWAESEWRWYVDRTADVQNELDRLYTLMICVPDTPYSASPLSEFDAAQFSRIGLCGADMRALDPGKLDQATAGMTMPLQVMARERLARARATFDNLVRAAKSKVDTDPDYKRLLIDAPQAAWKKWEADYQKHKKAMDATFKFEDQLFGPSVKAYGSCWKDLEPGVQQYVKASKIKSEADFHKAMSQPIGYALLTALGSCYAVTAPPVVGVLLLASIERSRDWRGPRAAVAYAMLDAFNDIKADRTRFPMGPGTFTHGFVGRSQVERMAHSTERTKIPSSGGHLESTSGVVKAVKKDPKTKELVHVTYKAESWMEPMVTCKKTGRIYKIDSTGSVIYEENCRPAGKSKRTFTPKKTTFPAWSVKGLKPNGLMKFGVPPGSQDGNQGRSGFPIEIYTNKQKKKLINIYGFTP